MALHTALAALWICLPIPVWGKIVGMSASFVGLVLGGRYWWLTRLLKGDAASASKPDSSWDDLSLVQTDLQHFIVEHMQFAVLSVWSDLGFRLETKFWPHSFGEQIDESGEDFIKCLGRLTRLNLDDQGLMRFQMQHAFGMNAIQWNVTAMNLPREAQLHKGAHSFVRISYIPLFQEEKLTRVHVIMQDISEIKEREDQAQQQRREMEKFFALLQVSDSLFELFMSETRKLFDEIKSDLKLLRENKAKSYQEVAGRMFRAVHTIKANARLFKLNSIQDVAHQVENFLEELRSGTRVFAPKTLGELTQQIMTISEEVYSYASLRKEILNTTDRNSGFHLKYRVQWIRSLMNQFASVLRDPKFEKRHLQLIQKEFSRALLSFDKASLKEYVRGYDAMLQDVATQLGKEVCELQTQIEFHSFDSSTLARINDILLHCMRNAIDHGIERPEDRINAGKSRKGSISLSTKEKEGIINIRVVDDGRGIDIERVKAKAVEKGFYTTEQVNQLNDAEVVSLLFQAGMSTADSITEISGRGFGMDVVRDYVQGLNGQLTVEFEKGKGTTISIWIPAVSEEQMIPLAIHDLRDVLEELRNDHTRAHERSIIVESKVLERMPLFTDRSSLVEVMRVIMAEMISRVPRGDQISIEVHELPGRRRVDSHSFYRLQIGSKAELSSDAPSGDGKAIETAGQMIRRNGGSLIVKHPLLIELNIPSNIPVRFDSYCFNVLIMTERSTKLEEQVGHFFANVMGAWNYKTYIFPFLDALPPELNDSPCIVLLDSALIKSYMDLRSEGDRKKDGVVLFPEEELDIDTLNGSAILPENILFLPPIFDEKHFDRCMASVIYRRFIKEMVREHGEAEEGGLSSAA